MADENPFDKAFRDGSEAKGPKSEEEILELVEELYLALRHARFVYEKDTFQGVCVSVHEILRFVHSLVPWDSAIDPIRALDCALHDLNNGSQPRLLTPHKKLEHRPPDNTEKRIVKVHAAVMTDLLMKAELSKTAAAKEVVKALKKGGFNFGQLRNPVRSVLEWRDRLNDPHGKEEIQVAFRQTREEYSRGLDHLSSNEVRSRLLDALTRNVRDTWRQQ